MPSLWVSLMRLETLWVLHYLLCCKVCSFLHIHGRALLSRLARNMLTMTMIEFECVSWVQPVVVVRFNCCWLFNILNCSSRFLSVFVPPADLLWKSWTCGNSCEHSFFFRKLRSKQNMHNFYLSQPLESCPKAKLQSCRARLCTIGTHRTPRPGRNVPLQIRANNGNDKKLFPQYSKHKTSQITMYPTTNSTLDNPKQESQNVFVQCGGKHRPMPSSSQSNSFTPSSPSAHGDLLWLVGTTATRSRPEKNACHRRACTAKLRKMLVPLCRLGSIIWEAQDGKTILAQLITHVTSATSCLGWRVILKLPTCVDICWHLLTSVEMCSEILGTWAVSKSWYQTGSQLDSSCCSCQDKWHNTPNTHLLLSTWSYWNYNSLEPWRLLMIHACLEKPSIWWLKDPA